MQLLLPSQPFPLQFSDLLLLLPHLAAVHLVPEPPLVLPQSLLAPPHVPEPLQLVLPFLPEFPPVLLPGDGVASPFPLG